jgi:hypothetical protein
MTILIEGGETTEKRVALITARKKEDPYMRERHILTPLRKIDVRETESGRSCRGNRRRGTHERLISRRRRRRRFLCTSSFFCMSEQAVPEAMPVSPSLTFCNLWIVVGRRK